MLSQKLQDDLMVAYQKVYEDKKGHAAGDSDTEKQASQLASDVRYKAKGKVPLGASDEEKKKIFLKIQNHVLQFLKLKKIKIKKMKKRT